MLRKDAKGKKKSNLCLWWITKASVGYSLRSPKSMFVLMNDII
jgi:hypothetical protein